MLARITFPSSAKLIQLKYSARLGEQARMQNIYFAGEIIFHCACKNSIQLKCNEIEFRGIRDVFRVARKLVA